MFGFGRKSKETTAAVSAEQAAAPGLLQRLKQGLARTRANFTDGLTTLVLGRKQIDQDLLDELETLLLTADVGVAAGPEDDGDLHAQVQHLAHLARHLLRPVRVDANP